VPRRRRASAIAVTVMQTIGRGAGARIAMRSRSWHRAIFGGRSVVSPGRADVQCEKRRRQPVQELRPNVTSANDNTCDMGINRRVFVAGGGSAVMGLGLLTAACGASGTTAAPASPSGSVAPTSADVVGAAPTSAAARSAAAATKPAAHRGVPLGKAAAVPVGGGAVFAAQKVVVTQPQVGKYVGLSAVCTHEGCIVGSVAGGTINCPCHGSRYHLDGTVARGPAPRALAPRPVAVVDGELELG
jgi:Rieske Fe-S protein